jgi:predicted  nucleic acid-binding Zn-ribbon protein
LIKLNNIIRENDGEINDTLCKLYKEGSLLEEDIPLNLLVQNKDYINQYTGMTINFKSFQDNLDCISRNLNAGFKLYDLKIFEADTNIDIELTLDYNENINSIKEKIHNIQEEIEKTREKVKNIKILKYLMN